VQAGQFLGDFLVAVTFEYRHFQGLAVLGIHPFQVVFHVIAEAIAPEAFLFIGIVMQLIGHLIVIDEVLVAGAFQLREVQVACNHEQPGFAFLVVFQLQILEMV